MDFFNYRPSHCMGSIVKAPTMPKERARELQGVCSSSSTEKSSSVSSTSTLSFSDHLYLWPTLSVAPAHIKRMRCRHTDSAEETVNVPVRSGSGAGQCISAAASARRRASGARRRSIDVSSRLGRPEEERTKVVRVRAQLTLG